MKNKIIAASIITTAIFLNISLSAQSTTDNNNIGFGKFLGYNDAQNLDFRTNNTTRMRLHRNTGLVNVNNQSVDLSGNLAIGQNLAPSLLPLSRLHIIGGGGVPLVDGYRSWMAYGAAFSVDGLDMYVGPGKF